MIDLPAKTDNPSLGSVPSLDERGGYIIIELARKLTDDSADLRKVATSEGFRGLKTLLAENPGLKAERVIRSTAPRVIRDRERIAGLSGFAPLETLTAFWRIDVRHVEDSEALRNRLQHLPEISLAYHETAVLEASGFTPATNPYFQHQGYLEARPKGIGAIAAWSTPGCDGSGVRVVDLEAGWILHHEDLPGPQLLAGDNGTADGYVSGDHGAAAMGVIGACSNGAGIIGIAPNIGNLSAASHYDVAQKTGLHVADAILAVMPDLQPGDIVLMAIQRHQEGKAFPVEIDFVDLQAIRLLAAHGVIVVEAAGNGEQNLDLWIDPTGQHCLDVNSDKHIDSGAIMVASASASVIVDSKGVKGHKRYYTSNFGSRINVYAWGEHIYTCGYGTIAGASGKKDAYTSNFGQTSGASAIIAGAAALVQSWHGGSLLPVQMRTLLSNPDTSTQQANFQNDPIGVMPDIDAIVSAAPGNGGR